MWCGVWGLFHYHVHINNTLTIRHHHSSHTPYNHTSFIIITTTTPPNVTVISIEHTTTSPPRHHRLPTSVHYHTRPATRSSHRRFALSRRCWMSHTYGINGGDSHIGIVSRRRRLATARMSICWHWLSRYQGDAGCHVTYLTERHYAATSIPRLRINGGHQRVNCRYRFTYTLLDRRSSLILLMRSTRHC